MQLTLQVPSPNGPWDAIHGIIAQKKITKNTCPLMKPGLPNVFAKTRRRITSVQRKFRPWSNTILPMQVSKKQNGSNKCFQKLSAKVKKRSGQWGMSNLFRKNSEISPFFDDSWRRKNGEEYHRTPLN